MISSICGLGGDDDERLVAALTGKPQRSRLKINGKTSQHAEGRHLAAEARLAVEPLEHGDVGVGLLVVAVDARIGRSRTAFRCSRDSEKFMPLVTCGHAALGLVAVDLALLGDDGPEERHQGLATGLGRVAPEGLLQSVDVRHAAIFLGHQDLFGAAEYFLPAQAVGHQQHDVFGGRFCGRLGGSGGQCRCREQEESKCQVPYRGHAVSPDSKAKRSLQMAPLAAPSWLPILADGEGDCSQLAGLKGRPWMAAGD